MSAKFVARVTLQWGTPAAAAAVAWGMPLGRFSDTTYLKLSQSEGGAPFYWMIAGNRIVSVPYDGGSEASPPSVVPFAQYGEGYAPWSQDLQAFALDAMARGAVTPQQLADTLNSDSYHANAVVNSDGSVSSDVYSFDDDMGDMLGLALFALPFAGMMVAWAAATAAASTAAAGSAGAAEVGGAETVEYGVAEGSGSIAQSFPIDMSGPIESPLDAPSLPDAPLTETAQVPEWQAQPPVGPGEEMPPVSTPSLPNLPSVPLNADTLKMAGQVISTATGLVRMVEGLDATGAHVLYPTPVDQNGNPLIYSGQSASVLPYLLLAGAALAIASN